MHVRFSVPTSVTGEILQLKIGEIFAVIFDLSNCYAAVTVFVGAVTVEATLVSLRYTDGVLSIRRYNKSH